MKWLARICLILLCFCLLSCSSSSIIFLHNDSPESFKYEISANIGPHTGKGLDTGTLLSGDATQTLVYSHSKIDWVTLKIKQNGKIRTRTFVRDDFPESLRSGGGLNHIKVNESTFSIGGGSGNWATDFQNQYWILFAPCGCLSILAGVTGLILFLRFRRKSTGLLTTE